MQFWIDQGVTAMETDYPEVLVDLLNLPLLAYRELCDEDISSQEVLPEIKRW